jgi:hypothetical protein
LDDPIRIEAKDFGISLDRVQQFPGTGQKA